MKLGIALGIAAAFLWAGTAAAPTAKPPALLTYSAGEPLVGPKGLCIAGPRGLPGRLLLQKPRYDVDAAWSPKGRYVAFARYRDRPRAGAISEIFLATAHGRIVRNLTRGIQGVQAFNLHPSWSPDGRRIAFETAWRGSRIYLVDRKGTNLAPTPILGEDPQWTLDGARIVFTVTSEAPPRSDIYSAELTGANERLLLKNAEQPALSPDGRRLAFVRWPEIWAANADGSEARPFIEAPAGGAVRNPAWSPDGEQIAYVRAVPSNSRRTSVVVADAETGRDLYVLRGPGGAYAPSWRTAAVLPKANRRACR